MAGFACAACGAEFETQERLDDHVEREHSGVEQDAGSAHIGSAPRSQSRDDEELREENGQAHQPL